ncbi:MAG: CGNR zinc finger domain-containing protein [Solirubrobacteraceae bacterium]
MTVAGVQRQPTTAQPRPRVSERELESGRSLREAINRLARPGVVPEPGDRLEMNRWGAYPPLAPQLTAQGELVWVSERPVVAAFAAIARDGIDLLTGPLAGRTRECAAPDCALLFVDSSRPGRRRWCGGGVWQPHSSSGRHGSPRTHSR